MNFDYTEEQNMLKESISRFIEDNYSFDDRNKVIANDQGFSQEHWQTYAELGWLSIPFAEEHGGFGGNVTDCMMVMEEFGKGLVAEPFIATVVMFGGLLKSADNAALQESLIPPIIDGSLQGAFAFSESQSRYDLSSVSTTAQKNSDGQFVINGKKIMVLNGMSADKAVVSVRTSGDAASEDGISLLVVDLNSPGVSREAVRMMDGQVVADISFDNTTVSADQIIGQEDKALPLIEQLRLETIAALGGEAIGIMQKLYHTTVEYTKTREQFGVAIGSFQALQHRMVEMFMACEQTRSSLYRAVCSINAGSDDVQKDVLALKVLIGKNGKLITDEAFQIHGGIGMTDELDVGHYAKRLMMINHMFGDADYSQDKYIKLSAA